MGTEKTAADAHQQAAEQVERAKGLVGQALGQIEEISRGRKNETHDGKAMPSEDRRREDEAAEAATDRSPADRLAD